MIKVFEWGNKLNVVDDRNNFVGFDLSDDCCARGGYFISDHVHDNEEDFEVLDQQSKPSVLPENNEYYFNETFFRKIQDQGDGIAVVFELVYGCKHNEGVPEMPTLYLHLFNCHNGYYAKGFKCAFREIQEGEL